LIENVVNKEICRRIAYLFKNEEGDTQDAISNKLGIQRTQFGRIINGKLNPTLQQVCAIASHYKARVGWIVEGESPVYKKESDDQKPSDSHLLTLVENYVASARLNLDELSKAIVQPLGPGTNAHPHLSQTLSKSDRKNRKKKPEGT
jgi:transcriptional regulator with XRE-family HTH domain